MILSNDELMHRMHEALCEFENARGAQSKAIEALGAIVRHLNSVAETADRHEGATADCPPVPFRSG